MRSNHQLHYRTASIDDIPRMISLALVSYGKYASQLTPENLAQMNKRMSEEKMWLDILAVSQGFLCMDNENVVGMAFLTSSGNPWEMFGTEVSYIRMVGVDPRYEGMGIATELMKKCIAHGKETGEQTIALHTSEVMEAARHIYGKLGFTMLKEIPPRLGLKYWMYTLTL